ncbi:7200_t:CDS:1, partial [Gigaspora rosea]
RPPETSPLPISGVRWRPQNLKNASTLYPIRERSRGSLSKFRRVAVASRVLSI